MLGMIRPIQVGLCYAPSRCHSTYTRQYTAQMDKAFTAAEKVGIKLFFSFDMVRRAVPRARGASSDADLNPEPTGILLEARWFQVDL